METTEVIPPPVEDIPVPVDVMTTAAEASPAPPAEEGSAAPAPAEGSPAAAEEVSPAPEEGSPAPVEASTTPVEVEVSTAPVEVSAALIEGSTAPVDVSPAEAVATAAEKELAKAPQADDDELNFAVSQDLLPSAAAPAATAPAPVEAGAAPPIVVANFESAVWEPQLLKYGLQGLLHVRQVLLPIPKPPEVEHMKFLVCPTHDDRFDGDGELRGGGERRGKGKNKEKGSGRGRNVPDMGRTEVVPGRQKGQWWRNITETEVIVREGITIASKEIAKVSPGHYIQQAAGAEVFINGRACGLQRMPVLPKGWVTLDATAVGGPVYLQPVKAPKWKVVYTSGSKKGDIVVRSSISLDSKEVAVLLCGTEVEQSGPQERLEDGIIRMPIVFGEGVGLDPATSSTPKVRVGWVTCDATIMGGPQFFRPCSQPADQEVAAQTSLPQQPLQGRPEQQQGATQNSEQQQSEDPPPTSLPPQRQGASEQHTGGGAKWDKNRLWMVVSVEPNTKQLPVVTRPEPFAPGTGHVAPEEVIVRWLTNGDLVEQVGHSKKIRGYMVMPIKCRTSTDGERLPPPQPGAQPDGWVTRRSVDRSREEGRSSWFEELQADEDGAVRVRRPRGGGGGNVSCPTLTL